MAVYIETNILVSHCPLVQSQKPEAFSFLYLTYELCCIDWDRKYRVLSMKSGQVNESSIACSDGGINNAGQ